MHRVGCHRGDWTTLLWWICTPSLVVSAGLNSTGELPPQPSCKQGHYCPGHSRVPVPCPRGTFGPGLRATSVQGCISCPPHHYGPREGLVVCLPCGPWAQQPLAGQDRCVCQGEGRMFQASDGQCPCSMGYRHTRRGSACELEVYDICKDDQTRSQHGECLAQHQWREHCAQQVCRSPEQYQAYDGSLGLCVCRDPSQPEPVQCAGWCRGRSRPTMQLVCTGRLELLYTDSKHQVSATGSVLESILKRWDSLGTLQCDESQSFSKPVYTVQTDKAGFFGVLGAAPAEVWRLFLEASQWTRSPEEPANTHNMTTLRDRVNAGEEWASHWSVRSTTSKSSTKTEGVLNPTTCLHLGDILLFTVTRQHYPQYDVENLYNTNPSFDWGPFRELEQELHLAKTAPFLFSVGFYEPGVYAFKLSSHHYKHMYVKVMPSGGECYDTGPFFPTDPHHVTRMGIARRRQLPLRPDWPVIGGLLVGAVIVLCLCAIVLILLREYGWPEKVATPAGFRALQIRYCMEDYSSKGSRVTVLKKTHRNLQVRKTEDSAQIAAAPMTDEFWDYEEQVDLEAFSASVLYEILLKHSVSVTARLGQLRGEVKQLYQGVLDKVRGLQPGRRALGDREAEGVERLCREVDQEKVRRKSMALQLGHLLDSQLQVLKAELAPQHSMHRAFGEHHRECVRLLGLLSNSQASLWDKHLQQLVTERVRSLAEGMAELVWTECQRQGAWAMLREGTGARLLCPASGAALCQDDIIAPDGSVRVNEVVHVDPSTGLIMPNANAHMLLASGHSMPVPPDFFFHPQTGRLLPVAGNVAFDPTSSTLVFTCDSGLGEVGKWESPLLPFVPCPPPHHGEPPPAPRMKGLRTGQRLGLGEPMCDPDTGLQVPILAVTIHPQTGLVYPLGGVHVCPISRLQQPIQIGSPMLDPRSGNLVLTVGVSLDPITGSVLPAGGLLLGESFIEPLSGRMVRVGGGSIRGGKMVPHAGGFQALLDSQVLGARARLVELLKGCSEKLASGARDLLGDLGRLTGAATDLEQAWRSSQYCMLQLHSRLEAQKEWARRVAQDGGQLGEIQVLGGELSLPALPGFEYPDPGDCGLNVPVLGAQLDWTTGHMVPLAGTMEDADGKGLVPICLGALTVDPVTGVLAPVVGARLDFVKKSVVPLTASQNLTVGENADSVQLEALQRERTVRMQYWSLQRQKEDVLLGDLDRALGHCLLTGQQNDDTVESNWPDTERQLREVAVELHEAAQSEGQRRASRGSELSLLLPEHVLLTLTKGDDLEWEQQGLWHMKLMAGLHGVSVCIDTQTRDHSLAQRRCSLDWRVRQREQWEQLNRRQRELEVSITALRCAREFSHLCADTAQSVLSGSFWYKDFGIVQPSGPHNALKMMTVTQHKVLPQLERLLQFLEDNKLPSLSTSDHREPSSDLSAKQVFELETCSPAWTASVPVVKGISTQSLKEQIKTQAGKDKNCSGQKLPSSSPVCTHTVQRKGPGGQGQDGHLQKESVLDGHLSVPILADGDWRKLMELSPLFHIIHDVEQQLRDRAKEAGLLKGEASGRGRPFIDFLDAQWECEGELVKAHADTLSPQQFLVYQHGGFLLRHLHAHKLTPAISLVLASSLPSNNYTCNAFRNSFYYQDAEETLYVRCQRLQSVGGFSLLLLHCAAHISTGHMWDDSCPSFQRTFFKVLQVCLSELFHSRLGRHSLAPERGGQAPQDTDSALNALLLERIQKPTKGILSEEEVLALLQKQREASALRRMEGLLRGRSLEASGDSVTTNSTKASLP